MAEVGPARIFIASASGALGPYRKAAIDVCHRLGLVPIHMENFDPEQTAPIAVCRREVDRCDGMVLLLAHRYGARPPGEMLSYTELEYEWAVKEARIPLLPFVVDHAFPWPPLDIDRGDDAIALASFVATVKSLHTVKRFNEVIAFREDLLLALRPFVETPNSGRARGPGVPNLPVPPIPHAVPPYIGSAPFTGRADDLNGLDRWAGSPDPVMVVEAIGGTGKSALAWEWFSVKASAAIDGLAGRLWWSFYDGSASMIRFLRELLAYLSGGDRAEIGGLEYTDLAEQTLTLLRQRPYLIVLDGFERLLSAYHRFDPSKLRDDEVELARRALIEPQAEDFVRQLTTVNPSKILISTRLMPYALEGRFGGAMPGVAQLRLPGLSDEDMLALLHRLGIHATMRAAREFFSRLGNHPLLVGIVAGLVRDYRPEPGGFDRWLADPTAGGALHVAELDLKQRRTHILTAALDGLPPGCRQVLGWISVLAGSADWSTLEAINPLAPPRPAPVEPDFRQIGWSPEQVEMYLRSGIVPGRRQSTEEARRVAAAARNLMAAAKRESAAQVEAWQASEPVQRGRVQLDAVLKELEDRGLLWWDRPANSYDLHPIVRAYTHDQLDGSDRVQANERVRDHFQALPAEDTTNITSVEDLRQTVTYFRALVGAGQYPAAAALWDRTLSTPLARQLGAFSTVVELLRPLAPHDPEAGTELAYAHYCLCQFDEAAKESRAVVRAGLDLRSRPIVLSGLILLAMVFRQTNTDIARSRCLEIGGLLEAPDGQRVRVRKAIQAAEHGDVATAKEAFRRALTTDRRNAHEIRFRQLELRFFAGESVTEDELLAASTGPLAWVDQVNYAELRLRFFEARAQFSDALNAAGEYERLMRNAGAEVTPVGAAYPLARLARSSEAHAAVDESLQRLARIHPSMRPHFELARALHELGRSAEANEHAVEAYRQAWGDGPPNCNHWTMTRVRALFEHMGLSEPELPVVDPVTVKVPYEGEIQTLALKPPSARRPGRQRQA
jgi:hypothetical protein